MATDHPQGDQSDFETFRATQDYEVRDVTAYATLASDLRAQVSGEVRFDEYSQILYATDGSIYQARPAGVVVPRDVADVQSTLRVAADHGVPVLPRGAGSSLAGQAVGPGCVVLDCSKYMDDILDIDADGKRVRVQPGVVQDDLDAALAPHGLQFAPDPASSNRATVGGGIGNNSTGAHSVRYGITDAYTEELDVVLADGSLIHTREVVLDSDEWEELVGKDDLEADVYRTVRQLVEENTEEIETRYPKLKRSVSGYNLHKAVYERDDGERAMNLSKLFVGAEGTLGVVVAATLSLVTKPEDTALALYCFRSLFEAMEAVPEALKFDVSAVELMDDDVFRLARESSEFAQYAEPIPEDAAAALMIEFDSELQADFETAIAETDAHFVDEGAAFHAIEAYTDDDQADLWKLRKAAIPLLMSMDGDPKPYPFIEDATVPPDELAEYVRKFEAILADHGTSAAYFAHAGVGTLHIRPILNLKQDADRQTMRSISDDVTDLVLDHRGSFSGEHGDGLARTEFNPKMYGPQLWGAFQDLKTAFDPEWRMNPGKVVFREDNPTDMREHLRYGVDYASLESETTLDFDDNGGFAHLVELCNGCGTCRQTGSDTMCPTYRASKDEAETTRGRANMLRAAISGELDPDELYSERFQSEVLDLCIGCKGCMNDCPTGVDLAKLKAEVKHECHEREGATRRERLFANVDRFASLGSALAPVANAATKLPGSGRLLERAVGVAADRNPPQFASESFETWFVRRGSRVAPEGADHRVLLFPDTYTNYIYPEAGKAAVRVLEAAGVHVAVPSDVAPSGRAAYSEGFLDLARERAEHNVAHLAPYVADGWSVVFVEPSDAVMFQDEYGDLVGGAQSAAEEADGRSAVVQTDGRGAETPGDSVAAVGAASYGVLEFLDTYRLDDGLSTRGVDTAVTYHGHCNQKALNKDHHAAAVLGRVGYDVDALDSGCCGMAGSFGYETEHYDLSQAIGRILFDQIDESDGDVIVAPGASCRTQLGDRAGASRPPHPVELVDDAIEE